MFFISPAYAQAAGAAAQQDPFIYNAGLFAILIFMFWFMVLRPQNKKHKEHQAMLNAIQVGDEIVTQGGIAGKVRKIDDNFLTLEIAKNVEIHIQRNAVGVKLEKGTLKSL